MKTMVAFLEDEIAIRSLKIASLQKEQDRDRRVLESLNVEEGEE